MVESADTGSCPRDSKDDILLIVGGRGRRREQERWFEAKLSHRHVQQLKIQRADSALKATLLSENLHLSYSSLLDGRRDSMLPPKRTPDC